MARNNVGYLDLGFADRHPKKKEIEVAYLAAGY